MESTDSSAGSPRHHQPNLPPGFRFHPTDEELVVHYLKKKAVSLPLPVSIIAEVDLYKFDPWELPAKATFGEQEWYFFSPRDRKYPNGARPNRAATSGYWKATGTDKPVLTSGGTQKVGVKKALVFYGGKPPKGIKTNWIMHEYRLADNKPNNRPPGYHDPADKKNSLRLDDWVLCRIYKKSTASRPLDHHHHRQHHGRDIDLDLDLDHDQYRNHHHHDSILSSDDVFGGPMNNNNTNSNTNNIPLLRMMSVLGPQNSAASAAVMSSYGVTGLTENDHQMFDGMLSSTNTTAAAGATTATNNNGRTEYVATAAAETEAGNAAASSSLASLLSQPALHHGQQQTVLGALGDGIFQRPFPLPGMNWYS